MYTKSKSNVIKLLFAKIIQNDFYSLILHERWSLVSSLSFLYVQEGGVAAKLLSDMSKHYFTGRNFQGLSSYQLKLVALLFMSIDHLGAYGFSVPIFGKYYSTFRILGRIAAPLFLFTLTESIGKTSNQCKLLLRLYVAAILTGLTTTFMNYFFSNSLGEYAQDNIFFTYFYTAIYCILFEKIKYNVLNYRWRKTLLLSIVLLAIAVFPHFLSIAFLQLHVKSQFLQDFFYSFVCSPLKVQYTPLFCIMGVTMYFLKAPYAKAIVFILFSMLSYDLRFSHYFQESIFSDFFGYPQYWMALAAPFMLLYNGSCGKNRKWLFYIYYPAHRYVIIVFSYLVMLFKR